MSLPDKPMLLDLFCCEGGAAVGYSRAGFDVVGVDLLPRFAKRYPFEFHAADAIEFVKMYGRDFDVIHASPPCQRYSITNHAKSDKHPDLIGPVREALIKTGKPYVIENVVGAPLIDPLLLCWSMFYGRPTSPWVLDDDGTPLRMERHRLFESSVELTSPGRCYHTPNIQVAGSYGGARRDKYEARHVRHGGYVPSIPVQQKLLGIDWMTQHGMYQSVPPAYTKHIGRQVMAHLLERAA